MKTQSHLTLDDLIPKGMFVGTSLILQDGERFLYGMRPARLEAGRPVIELTGIGGSLEETDASYTAGVLREVEEEIGCAVRLIPCSETLVVRSQDVVERVTLAGAERPAVVVFRYHRTPPHQPWHRLAASGPEAGGAASGPEGGEQGCLLVFLGELAGRPRPLMELPWLIWLSPEQVLATAWADVPLAELLAEGAELVLGDAGPPPNGSWTRLTDSQEALGLALGPELPAYYRSLR
jgi:hypothetical protein